MKRPKSEVEVRFSLRVENSPGNVCCASPGSTACVPQSKQILHNLLIPTAPTRVDQQCKVPMCENHPVFSSGLVAVTRTGLRWVT